ncbi:MAG: PilZ domain-containing protein [Acidithiobacillus sp.]|nr:PilZ domain-containing protein [Acidithiobacillus sp.]
MSESPLLKAPDQSWERVPPAATQRILSDARSTKSFADLLLANDDLIHSRFLPEMTENTLLFDAHLRVMADRLPERGDQIAVQWLRKRDGYHYGFQAISMGMRPYAEDGLPAISVSAPKTLERTQRRHAFRVPVPLEDAQNLSIQWDVKHGQFRFPAFAHDLSIDGMRLSFTSPLSFPATPGKRDHMDISLSIHRGTYTVDAQVARVEKTGTPDDHASGRERFLLGMRFVEPYALFLKALERYVAERQRGTLREGAG